MKRMCAIAVIILAAIVVSLPATSAAQTKEETTIKIRKVTVEKGDTTTTEQTLTPQEFEQRKQKGEFKDIDIQMKTDKAERMGENIRKEIRVTSPGKSEKGGELQIEVREMKDGKETVKTLKGKEAEEYHKHMKHDDDDHGHKHKRMKKKVSKESKTGKKKE